MLFTTYNKEDNSISFKRHTHYELRQPYKTITNFSALYTLRHAPALQFIKMLPHSCSADANRLAQRCTGDIFAVAKLVDNTQTGIPHEAFFALFKPWIINMDDNT